jgi:hypothetical protein
MLATISNSKSNNVSVSRSWFTRLFGRCGFLFSCDREVRMAALLLRPSLRVFDVRWICSIGSACDWTGWWEDRWSCRLAFSRSVVRISSRPQRFSSREMTWQPHDYSIATSLKILYISSLIKHSTLYKRRKISGRQSILYVGRTKCSQRNLPRSQFAKENHTCPALCHWLWC